MSLENNFIFCTVPAKKNNDVDSQKKIENENKEYCNNLKNAILNKFVKDSLNSQ